MGNFLPSPLSSLNGDYNVREKKQIDFMGGVMGGVSYPWQMNARTYHTVQLEIFAGQNVCRYTENGSLQIKIFVDIQLDGMTTSVFLFSRIKIFVDRGKSTKTAKILLCENFHLYGMSCLLWEELVQYLTYMLLRRRTTQLNEHITFPYQNVHFHGNTCKVFYIATTTLLQT